MSIPMRYIHEADSAKTRYCQKRRVGERQHSMDEGSNEAKAYDTLKLSTLVH